MSELPRAGGSVGAWERRGPGGDSDPERPREIHRRGAAETETQAPRGTEKPRPGAGDADRLLKTRRDQSRVAKRPRKKWKVQRERARESAWPGSQDNSVLVLEASF